MEFYPCFMDITKQDRNMNKTTPKAKQLLLIICAFLVILSVPKIAVADYKKGIRFYNSKNYYSAMREFKSDNTSASKYFIGVMYLNGQGVKKNRTHGMTQITQSANTGYPNAQYFLWLTSKDKKWLKLASDNGHKKAYKELHNTKNTTTKPSYLSASEIAKYSYIIKSYNKYDDHEICALNDKYANKTYTKVKYYTIQMRNIKCGKGLLSSNKVKKSKQQITSPPTAVVTKKNTVAATQNAWYGMSKSSLCSMKKAASKMSSSEKYKMSYDDALIEIKRKRYRCNSSTLLSIGAALSAPLKRGETSWGKVADALAGNNNSKSNTKPDFQTKTLMGNSEGWGGETLIYLSNGEVWQQIDGYYNYDFSYRPTVRIYKVGRNRYMQLEGIDKNVSVIQIR